MKKLLLCFFLNFLYSNPILAQDANLFDVKLAEFATKAKELSKKHLSEDDINYLSNAAWSIIEDMKNRALTDKLKTNKIIIKYSNNKNFPSLKGVDKADEKIIRFAMACSLLYKYITKDTIKAIIKKSPLEMVSMMRELDMFFKFVSADPGKFGHGVFSKKKDKDTEIFATNDAILRILKVLVYTDLLGEHRLIYKLSRLASYLCNNYETATLDDFQTQINNLKRSTIDDSRIALYVPKVVK